MKRLAFLVFAAVAALGFVADRASAQEAFAPLVQKETVLIVRVDLSKVDAKTTTAQLTKLAEAGIDYILGADSEQAVETKKTLPLIGAFGSQYFNAFVQPFKDAGVSEAFVVIDQSADLENPIYPYLAIPTAGMTEDQVKDVRAALSTLNKSANNPALKYRFVRGGFVYAVFIPADVDETDAKEYVKKRFAKPVAVDATPFAEGFKLVGTDAFLTGAGIAVDQTETVQKQLEALEGLDDESNELNGALKTFVEKMLSVQKTFVGLSKYNAWKVDLDKLEFVSYLQTNSDADAAKYLEEVAKINKDFAEFADVVTTSALENVGEDFDQAAVDALKDAVVAVCDACFDAVKADGATISWALNEQFFVDNESVVKGLIETIKNVAPKSVEDAESEFEEDATDAELDLEAL